jgi:hypothetical protein
MALAVLAFAACGDNDGNCVESVDVAGEWEMTTTDVIDSCGGRVPYTFPMTITPNGNALTAELPGGTLTGTICGDQVRLSGSFPEDDGTVTVSVALIVSADGDSMQGSDSWSWTDGSTDCSGSDSLSGTRTQEFPCTEQGIRDAVAEGGGPHTFSCNGPQIVTTEAEIVIDNDVILHGEGNLTVDGNEEHRVFLVSEGVTAELRGFTVTRGGEFQIGMGDPGYINGCIENGGTLTLTDTTVSENKVGIGNGGTLTLTNSTVTGSETFWGIASNGTLTLTNSTVSGNAGEDRAGISVLGGAVTLLNTTMSDNIYVQTPPDDSSVTATIVSTATLVDGACVTGAESRVTWASNGYNIESPGNTCGFDPDGTDQVNVSADDLNLGELADNGGPTMTHALLTEPTVSLAIDQIPEAACVVTTDQRGMPRPGERMCDVGSVELQSHELP